MIALLNFRRSELDLIFSVVFNAKHQRRAELFVGLSFQCAPFSRRA